MIRFVVRTGVHVTDTGSRSEWYVGHAMSPDPTAMSPRMTHDSGQAVVEAAIALPAMTFLILTIIQLTALQHARIMTDYAAFCAARAGIVFNGDAKAMEQAAMVALSPTIGRTDNLSNFTYTMTSGTSGTLSTVSGDLATAKRFNLPGIVEVQALPPPSSAGAFSTLGAQLDNEEVDFDDIRAAADQWNILQIRLRYFYRMRIPFANQILQAIYFAATAAPDLLKNSSSGGGWQGFDMTYAGKENGAFLNGARGAYAGSQGGTAGGMPIVPESALIAEASREKVYYFPLTATYSMRMQSNWYINNAPQ